MSSENAKGGGSETLSPELTSLNPVRIHGSPRTVEALGSLDSMVCADMVLAYAGVSTNRGHSTDLQRSTVLCIFYRYPQRDAADFWKCP